MLPRLRPMVIVVALAAATASVLSAPTSAGAAPGRASDVSISSGGGSATPFAVPAAGTFYPTAVHRVLGTSTSGSPVAPGSPVTVPTAGGGVPSSGVSALMVNITATAGPPGARLSFAAPAATAMPEPLVTVPAGTTRSTLVTVPLATASAFVLATTGGPAMVTADVLGFYAADDTVVAGYGVSGGYQPVDATRVAESTAATAIPAAGRRLLAVDLGGTVTAHTTALLVKVTVKDPTAPGSLNVGAATAPTTASLPSSVSFAAGGSVSNLALVPAELDSSGRIGMALTNGSAAPLGYAIDLVGFYDDGGIGPNLRFRPLPQTRILDTTDGTGALAPVALGTRARTSPPASVASDSTFGLVGVLTASTPAPATLAVFPDDITADAAEDNPLAAGTTSVAVQPEIGVAGGLGVVSGGAAPSAVRLDVVGSFEAYPPVTNPASRRWVPPVSAWQISAASR